MKIIKCLNVLLGVILLFACTPTSVPIEVSLPEADPPAGSVMRWVDGSQVIVVDMDPTEGQVWVSQTDITHYMYSFCVAAGQCVPARLDTPGEHGPDSPIIEPCISVQDVQSYCEWAGGRLATEQEVSASAGSDKSIGTQTATFRCAIDSPHAAAPFCQTSAIYFVKKHIGKPKYEDIYLNTSGQFCQNGQGYVTVSLGIEGCETESILDASTSNGEAVCEMVDEQKLVCYGTPGSTANAIARVSCEGDPLPAIEGKPWQICWADQIPYPCYDDALAQAGIFCQAGYQADPASPSSCDWSGNLLNQTCLQGADANPLNGGGYSCALARYNEGAGSGSGGQPPAVSDRKCMYPMCGGVNTQPEDPFNPETETAPPTTSVICPMGMYFDPQLMACVSLGAYDDQCLAGYAYDEMMQCCQSAIPNGEYPGCPAGEVFDAATGMCDPNTIITADAILHTVEFDLNLPACGGASGDGSCQLTASDCASQGGQELDAQNCKCVPVQ